MSGQVLGDGPGPANGPPLTPRVVPSGQMDPAGWSSVGRYAVDSGAGMGIYGAIIGVVAAFTPVPAPLVSAPVMMAGSYVCGIIARFVRKKWGSYLSF